MPAHFSLPSYAKINWMLRILGKREDGFHEIFTLFQTISLHDTLIFAEADSLTLTCNSIRVPVDGRNLIIKAAKALQQASGLTAGARIRLEKRIPSPGGLGGGSSNAAAALFGLKRLWKLNITHQDMATIAAEIGSDVSFFLQGGTAIGVGRGDTVEPLVDMVSENLLIVTPRVQISTRKAYAALDTEALTIEARNRILPVCRNEAVSLDPLHSALKNDFEASVFAAYPEVKRVKESLLELGAANAAMSGSGASVFAVFDKKETRQAAINALDQESTWRKFAVSTISRDEFREALQF